MSDRFEEACGLFDQGRFFEAHEVWEELWRPRRLEPEAPFLQGLIQLAAAYHLLGLARPRPAARLLASALAKLAPFADDRDELPVEELRVRAHAGLVRLRQGGGADVPPPPRLRST